jgi:hypothetical protein
VKSTIGAASAGSYLGSTLRLPALSGGWFPLLPMIARLRFDFRSLLRSPLRLSLRFPLRSASRASISLAAAALVLSALVGWTLGHYLLGLIEREAMQRARAEAVQLAERLDQVAWAGARELLALAATPSVAEPALRPQQARPALDATRRALPAFHWVGIADGSGRILNASGGELEGQNVSGQLAYRQARLARRVAGIDDAVFTPRIVAMTDTESAQPAHLDDLDGAARSMRPAPRPVRFLDLSVATFDANGGPSGVLLGQLGWDRDTEPPGHALVDPLPGAPRGEVLVVAGDGTVVMASDPAMAGRLVDTRITDGAGRGMEAGWTRRWPDGHHYQTVAVTTPGYRDFGGLGWTVVWRQPLAHALGVWRHLPLVFAAFAVLLCMLGLMLSGRHQARAVGAVVTG